MRSTPCVALVFVVALALAGCARDAAAPEATATPSFVATDPLAPEADAIHAAVNHSCSILAGSLRCWGGVPAGAQPAGSFVLVTGGEAFGCALAVSGSAACWGTGESGELDAPAETFAELGSGTSHTCGVTTAGAVTCWGANDAGQSDPPAGTWVRIDAGGRTTCAIDGAGLVGCWGDVSHGQQNVPPGTFYEISVGATHVCGIRAGGSLICWGDDANGKTSPPRPFYGSVSAGTHHSCGIEVNGTASCWGSNEDGQSMVPDGPFTRISAGHRHTCATRPDRTIECWGWNGSGQTTVPGNAVPEASVGGPYAGDEGDAIVLSLSGSDPDGDALEYAWSLGDGTEGTGEPPATHIYANHGEFTIALTVRDPSGAEHTASTTASISNVSPVGSLAGPTDPIGLKNGAATASLVVSFTDPGVNDAFTVRWQCGPAHGFEEVPAAASPATFACAYTAPGVHVVRAEVLDDGPASTGLLEHHYAVVYDAGAGHVAGGGWIRYGGDACDGCDNGGRAEFGFSSPYRKGGGTPAGDTQFRFGADGLRFVSTSYESLSINGSRAQFRGTGTVEGAGDYAFVVTAIEGGRKGVDAFRIRITDRTSGSVVFDNQRGEAEGGSAATPLDGVQGGGAIVMQAK